MMHERTAQFLEFCERQKPDKHYDWDNSERCALGQFCRFDSTGWDQEEFTVCNEIAGHYPREFGALSARLRRIFGGAPRQRLYYKFAD
jgi:hypothetical protein